MNKLLDEEYYLFGTNNIYKELWLNIQMLQNNPNYIKPIGGLWLSHQRNGILCDWISFLESKGEIYYKEYVGSDSSSLVKLKEDCKLLSIQDNTDFKNLKDSALTKKLTVPAKYFNGFDYKTIDEIPDYEKIAELYDSMYVIPYADISLRCFSVPTMLALKAGSIEYYKSLKVDYDNHEILSISEKKVIDDYFKNYDELVKYTRDLFNATKIKTFVNYDEYIVFLNQLKERIVSYLNSNLNIDIPEHINKKSLIEAVVGNIYKELYKDEQKRLILKP